MTLQVEILTLFTGYFESPLSETMIKRAIENGSLNVELTDIRDFAKGKHRQCDDVPFGGGAGMVMMPEPVASAIEAARNKAESHVVLLSPRGRIFNQQVARELVEMQKRLVFVCGRYEGIDHRVRSFVDDEISCGDFVVSGGEPIALVILDALYRLVPGALGNEQSLSEESFSEGGTLEYPQFTRPREFRGMVVPEVLFSGNHQEIAKWREMASLAITRKLRRDLFDKIKIDDKKAAELILWEKENGNYT